MVLLYISIPLMLFALAIALAPLLWAMRSEQAVLFARPAAAQPNLPTANRPAVDRHSVRAA
ncbi:MAG TPA: cbb3-type cytochrome oxidase assembly protein CcoS [Acidimicrobiales bacterium]|nr:cbb3-type cytochrome oxidase assembly protein CcoS [Acidimicrobiales bacterium]